MSFIRDEVRQVALDTSLAPELADRYVHHAPKRDALETIRQVSLVTNYLSRMATGQVRVHEGVYYGTVIACIDEVTDEMGEDLSDGSVRKALVGDSPYPSLDVLEPAYMIAHDSDFAGAMVSLAKWQDESQQQFGDPSYNDLMEITYHKGAYSAAANLLMVKDDVSSEEYQFTFEFGFLMQLLDDHLDQQTDEEAGISTLFTEDLFSVDDLELKLETVMDNAEIIFGESRASKRLRRILKTHLLIGKIENRTPIPVSKTVPWYI